MKTKIVVVAGAAALLALAGCSSDSSSTDASPSPAAETSAATMEPTMEPTTEASPEASMIGPIMVTPDQTEVEATVGRTIVFDVGPKPGKWDIETDDPTILAVTKGGKKDGAVFNPGAEALAEGTATVTLTDTKSGLDALQYTVTVTP